MANLSNINGKFVVDTAGNIGVGTTDPNFLIEAAGVNSEIALNSTSGSIYRVRSTSSDAFIITKNGVGDRLVIDGSGNSTFSGSVRVTNPTQSNYWLYNAAKTNGFLLGRSLASNDGQDFFIFDTVANSASMTINSSQNATFAGSVIGTLARFDTLNNNANSANIIYRSGTNTIVGNNASALVVQDGGNVGIGTNSPDYLLDLSKTAVAVDTYSGINLQASNYGYTIEGGLTQNVGGELIFSSNNAGTRNPRVKFTANGKVGIGVTDPKNTLNIFSGTDTMMGFWGTSTYSAMQSVNLANTVLKDMRFDFAEAFFIGNAVGIGTDSPSAKLEVVTAVGGDAIRLNFGQSADIFLGFNSANPRILLQDNSNVVTHNFQSNGDNYIVGSNVGIGTTSPRDKLTVKTPGSASIETGLRLVNPFGFGSALAGARLVFAQDRSDSENYEMAAIQSTQSYGGSSAGGGLAFYTRNTTLQKAMHIKNSGTVEIPLSTAGSFVQMGTTNSGSKLNVGGTIAAATNDLSNGMIVPRSLGLSHTGNTGTFTRTFNPVTLFGMPFRGGQVLFECTGWQMAMNNGYIMWRNAGGGDPIGTSGSVQYVQTAYVSGAQSGSNTIAVSLNGVGSNDITITFTGWHGNSHGFMCRITTNYM